MKFILGRKVNMTQIWKGDRVVPVTVVQAGPCQVTQIKTLENDGYESVQIGFEKNEGKERKTLKNKDFKVLREFRVKKDDVDNFKVNSVINVSIFQEGDKVRVSGFSKGKGFQGGVKRWGFHGRNATHGVKHEHRTIGSVGCRFPQRVIKGRKMPGHTGVKRYTVKNLEIVGVNKNDNLLLIKGALPGRRGNILEIKN